MQLSRQFAGGAQHEHDGGPVGGLLLAALLDGLFGDADAHQGQGGALASAGLGLGYDVAALQSDADEPLLDRRRLLPAVGEHPALQVVAQPHGAEVLYHGDLVGVGARELDTLHFEGFGSAGYAPTRRGNKTFEMA